jgi:two-component system response regulator HydG
MDEIKILFVDDEEEISQNVYEYFAKEYNINICLDPKSALQLLKNKYYDIIISDYRMPHLSGLELLLEAKKINSYYYGILFTAFADKELLERAINHNLIKKVIEKPLNFEILRLAIKDAITECRLKKQAEDQYIMVQSRYEDLKESVDQSQNMVIGLNGGLKDVYKKVKTVAEHNINVLLVGETGTGKELIARLIHKLSMKYNEAFIDVNCSAIPDNLFESELFGYKKGAFTDARQDKPGKIELANKGTLFLDEIGELRIDMQSKLLRVLQEKSVQRLGDNKKRAIEFRLIVATNKSIEDLMDNKQLRDDLYYRINEYIITLPPLRERLEDIEALAYYFNKKYCDELRVHEKKITPQTINHLKKYMWPGNVREFENTFKHIIISFLSEKEIKPQHFNFIFNKAVQNPNSLINISEICNNIINGKTTLNRSIVNMKQLIIKYILKKFNGNISYALKSTGIKKDIFYTYK